MAALEDSLEAYRHISHNRLTSQQETYVLRRAAGLNPSAAARAAFYKRPQQACLELEENADVVNALMFIRQAQRETAIKAGAIEFTKDDATMLYLAAHAKSETATEEIRAVDSLVKLHGLASPEKKEIEITSRDQLREMDDDELMRLAGSELRLDPSQYKEVSNDE